MKKYTIKEGQHRSGYYFAPHFGVERVAWDFMFNENCLYKHKPEMGINKLCGLSFGFHHNYSVRIGWTTRERRIELYSYMYCGGVRFIHYLGIVDIAKIYTSSIFLCRNHFYVVIKELYNDSIDCLECSIFKRFDHNRCGYYLFPYFGGQEPAPHDMNIYLKRL